MSLKVWLPLTKDLRQQGLSDINMVNHNTTLNTNGKLGSCYYFNGNQQWIQFDSALGDFYNNDWSIACWLKPTDSTRGVIISEFSGSGASNVAIELNADRVVRLYWNGTPDIYFSTAGALPLNVWTHLVMTKKGREIKVYFDGSLKQTYTYTSDFSTRTSACQPRIGDDYRGDSANTVSYQGYINDFRMYDHCLSQMEVKELAKGLVLHYPLNRGGWGQENLFLNTGTAVTWSKALNDSGYATNDCFKTQTPVPSLFSVDELITISFDWSTTATGGNFHVECGAVTPWIWGTVVSSKGTRSSASNYIDITSSNQSGHVEITFKITSSQTGAADTLQWLRIRQDGADTANKTFIISSAKLERGSVATPWCPNLSDALGTALNINGTTEYDCSGYGNNGTRTGTFTWSSDTPKYNVSTEFNSSRPNYIQIPNSSYALQGAEAMTWSVWAYDDNWSNYSGRIYSCTEGGGVSIESGNSGASLSWAVNMYTAADKSTYAYQGYCSVPVSSLTPGWHLFTWTYTTSGTKIYVDGVLKNQVNITSYGLHFNTVALLHLGAEASGSTTPTTGYYFTGKLSDFRIYATALSAEDIKSLYQNSAYIDSNGNVYGAIHMEA